MPHFMVKMLARTIGFAMSLIPGFSKLVRANIRTAFPEKDAREVARIGRESFFHLIYNLLEFIWLTDKPARIEKYLCLPEDVTEKLKAHVAKNERIIFVNPHLGSWEASGLMAPYYAGVNMVAIAKPVRNPYLNNLLNKGNREKEKGLRIIFSRGAVRESIKALRNGLGVGTLVDQNTRVRDGGAFVDFFGLPVPSSKAPAGFMHYCVTNNIPAVIIYGTSVRLENGIVTAHARWLSKPFENYKDETEVMQELMNISEEYIRQFPEQYLWMYKRFQYIPREATPELKAKYPYYSTVAPAKFYSKAKRKNT
jgi:KDO2-lipid IV(A) lauroyltransferase